MLLGNELEQADEFGAWSQPLSSRFYNVTACVQGAALWVDSS